MKRYKPTTPSRRFITTVDYRVLTKGKKPEKSLTGHVSRTGGRSRGKITTRSRGGGHKKRYRFIDFIQNKVNIPGRGASLEYDLDRTSFIALIHHVDGA